MFDSMKIKSAVTLLTLLALLCAGCQKQRSQEESRAAQTPQRIVSISPNVTEILYAVGAWQQVVAVSQYCSYPDDVKNKPRVSGWDKTNLEELTFLKPDLVIGVDLQAPFLQDKLNGLGVRSLFLRTESLTDVYNSIEQVGKVSGHEQQAADLLLKTKAEIETIRKKVSNRPQIKVLCIIDRVPGTLRELHTATRGSYLDELITIARGESISPPAEHGWGKITKEAVVSLNPEVIIDMVQGSKGDFGEDPIAAWRELSEVRAVTNNRVYSITDPLVIHPSQFVSHTAQVFARAIHPEAFSDGP